MPRLMASRLTAKAVFRCSGPTAAAMAARLAGRKSSETTAQRTVARATASGVRATGNARRMRPERKSEAVIIRSVPTRSQRRPANGEVTRAVAP
jgi:hypothetical protein